MDAAPSRRTSNPTQAYPFSSRAGRPPPSPQPRSSARPLPLGSIRTGTTHSLTVFPSPYATPALKKGTSAGDPGASRSPIESPEAGRGRGILSGEAAASGLHHLEGSGRGHRLVAVVEKEPDLVVPRLQRPGGVAGKRVRVETGPAFD